MLFSWGLSLVTFQYFIPPADCRDHAYIASYNHYHGAREYSLPDRCRSEGLYDIPNSFPSHSRDYIRNGVYFNIGLSLTAILISLADNTGKQQHLVSLRVRRYHYAFNGTVFHNFNQLSWFNATSRFSRANFSPLAWT